MLGVTRRAPVAALVGAVLAAAGLSSASASSSPPGGAQADHSHWTRSSRSFHNGRKNVTVLYGGAVNYRDKHGDWQPIDDTLVPSAAAGFAYENKADAYTLRLPADLSAPVAFEEGGDFSVVCECKWCTHPSRNRRARRGSLGLFQARPCTGDARRGQVGGPPLCRSDEGVEEAGPLRRALRRVTELDTGPDRRERGRLALAAQDGREESAKEASAVPPDVAPREGLVHVGGLRVRTSSGER